MIADIYLLQKFARGTGSEDLIALAPDADQPDTAAGLTNAY
jgi:hypothetical protein